MLSIAMIDLSTPFVLWLLIPIAVWISFVKSSIQAAIALSLIFILSSRFELFLATAFLLYVSLLIPKPNPRHQKRRFQLGKAFYVLLLGYATWTLSHMISKPIALNLEPANLDLATALMAPGTAMLFAIILLFTRRYVH
jgi:hypothetical protein